MGKHRNFIITVGTLLASIFVVGGSDASAQVLVLPEMTSGAENLQFAPVLAISSVDYHFDGGGSTTVDRTILGTSLAYGLHPRLDLYGEFGYIVKAELEDGGDDEGIQLGGGVRGLMWQRDRLSIYGLAGVRYINESYGSNVDGDVFEVPLAVILKGKLNREINLYGGIDIIPYTGGEVDFDRGQRDIEREDIVGLRLGGDYKLDNVITLNAEFALISEEAFMFRVSLPI